MPALPPVVRRAGLAVALLGACAACRAIEPRRELERLRAEATPTLPEIFLLPGIQGRPPRLERLTADGRWAFFRFSPLQVAADGSRSLTADGSLRVQSTLWPEATDFQGQSLAELLPPPTTGGEAKEGEPAQPELTLSHHGARVLALREHELFLLDPPPLAGERWSARLLLRADKEDGLPRLTAPRFTEDDRAVLVESADDLWLFPLDDPPRWPLRAKDGTNLTATVEADARRLSFSSDRKVVYGREPAVAYVSVPANESAPARERPAQILWRESGRAVELAGMADFPHVEGAELSPDGRFLFAMSSDRRKDSAPTLIPDYLSPRVSARDGRRELAEDLPAARKLHLWDTATGERTDLEFGASDVFWLRSSAWAPQPNAESPPRLVLVRLSEDFRDLWTFVWSEAKGLERVLVDRDERWIGGPVDRVRWSPDGARLIVGSESLAASSLPGRAQLFELDLATRELHQLTQVSGEVSSFDVAESGALVFSYCDDDARERRKLAWIPPGGEVVELDAPEGFDADPRIADDGTRIVFRHGRMFQPAELWTIDPLAGEGAVRLTRTIDARFAEREWIHPRVFEVEGERGARVKSHVFLPPRTRLERGDRPRACVVFIHGAGYLQNVTDSMTEYEPNLMFHSRLAGMGYVVVDVDYRGSQGYGQDFRTAVQYHLGGLELDDIHATLDALSARGVIDRERVACYGGSYGGFLTLMALFTAGERWSAGAALRSVTDWRTYHPSYTQPRLGRPSTHAEAYARSSPIDHAEKLEKPLLLLHGMMDSNVFAQDTIRLMEKLIDLGREFDVMLYPSQNHAFTDGAHWLDEYRRIERFLMEHLGRP